MKLKHLISALGISLPPHPIVREDIDGVFNDARKVRPDSIFVAIQGSQADGHQFIPDAIKNGASVLVVQDPAQVPMNFQGLVVPVGDSRAALDKLASCFYNYPANELFCIGVTGTNGKTSVTYMIEALLNAGSRPTGVIGTIDHHLQGQIWSSEMTTPDPLFLQKRLREFCDSGAKAVAMEVSSHALDQKRVDGVSFDVVVFTNLTRDHLDYHKDMKSYFQAKERLFTELLLKSEKPKRFAIINIQDEYGKKISLASECRKWTYGDKGADFEHEILEMGFSKTRFVLKTPVGTAEFILPMSGEHNVLNAVAAIATAIAAGTSLSDCITATNAFAGVPGRLQSVAKVQDLSIFVDYAHTPDALENVLTSLRRVRASLQSKAQIFTVFGCGGDRDKGKRPLMAQMALRLSDQIFITSDNPRTEDPQKIITEILTGVQGADRHRVHVEIDRKLAIESCIAIAKKDDVILIAGKGHEDYQIIGAAKTPFSDFKIAEEAYKKRGAT